MLKKIALCFAITILLAINLYAQENALEKPPIPKNSEEKLILSVIEDLNKFRGQMQNVSYEDGRLLRLLTEISSAKTVVEIGTSNGYSGLWFCLALRNTGGKLTTFDIDPERIKLAKENFKRAGVDNLVTIIEGDAHEQVKNLKGPIDIVFLDADKSGYPDYLNKLIPLIRPGGLILAHNVRNPTPSPEFLKAITTNPDLETVFLNMQSSGISATLKKH
jgi:caffeoyl-CoA O-methyltransferase